MRGVAAQRSVDTFLCHMRHWRGKPLTKSTDALLCFQINTVTHYALAVVVAVVVTIIGAPTQTSKKVNVVDQSGTATTD
jgi:hypothetical protein